jgi:hypothetical protein
MLQNCFCYCQVRVLTNQTDISDVVNHKLLYDHAQHDHRERALAV